MRMLLISVLAATALVTYRSAMLAAPQQTTAYPGQMTEARVWVQNRPDHGEAIPVRLESASRELPPLRVHVVNAQNTPVFDDPIRVRLVPQTWEYQSVVVPANQDVAERAWPARLGDDRRCLRRGRWRQDDCVEAPAPVEMFRQTEGH